MRTTPPTKLAAAGFAALTLVLTLGACGDDSNSAASPSASQTASNGDVFDQADVDFATDMIPHHAQAIEMVTLTDGRTLDPAVKQLADEIRDAQTPEVQTMSGWLTAWDEPIPATSLDHVNAGHDMSDMPSDGSSMSMGSDMPGMMSDQDMTGLENASDADFQGMWLQRMQQHHEGAIEMAKTEEADGKFPAAIALAKSIVTSQQAEIDQIKQLLAS